MPVPKHNTNRHNDDKYSNFALSIALLKARLFVEPAVIGRRRTKQNETNETDVDAELALLRQLVALRPQAVAHQGVARADRTDPDVSYLPPREVGFPIIARRELVCDPLPPSIAQTRRYDARRR